MSLSSGGSSAALDALVANNPDVLFVIAAGNGDIASLSYPAALAATYRNVIAVGASWGDTDAQGNSRNPGDRITYPGWWGSNYGTGLTIMGPSEVYTTQAFNSLGNVNFSYVDNFNGTSAATPNVAGVASLIWSANLDLTATDIREIITQTAFDLGAPGYDTEYGYGFINADAAVRRSLAIARGAA
jgi:subtilisin family serine protease